MTLQTKEAEKSYGRTRALQGVTFDIEPGNIYALLGPNGSGKTTWMKMAAALVRPSAGGVLWEGKPVCAKTRAQIVYLPTEDFFYSWMRVGDVGKYFADFFADFSTERYQALCGQMELPMEQKVRTLSTGMRAKCRAAAALSRSASVFLLDEPFNGIDLMARDQILGAILETSSPDNAIVISSHLVEEIEPAVNRAIFFREGRVAADLDIEELRAREGVSLADKYRELMMEKEA